MYYMGRLAAGLQAMFWHRKAAEQGKADAQYVVGAMYYTGNAVLQDHKQAVGWFRKAAEQNHAEAQQVLGLMYRYHMGGVQQDNVIAYMLWNLAAANGNANAADQRAAVVRKMTHEQVEEGRPCPPSGSRAPLAAAIENGRRLTGRWAARAGGLAYNRRFPLKESRHACSCHQPARSRRRFAGCRMSRPRLQGG
jgi:TPR repeat protein